MGIARAEQAVKLLFCVEFYLPSRGGAQEVMRQIAERMVDRGHEVVVATSRLAARTFEVRKGVRVVEFSISGNRARGFAGEIDEYRRFMLDANFDVVLFYAAQQWTFDAVWPLMPSIRGRKVFIPCGYSGLHDPAYSEYFDELPQVLRLCDQVVYHATNYRDVEFGDRHQIGPSICIPNGADDQEFSLEKDTCFRLRHAISDDAILLLTVGSFTGLKGHAEVLAAFDLADFGKRDAVLILNGNAPEWTRPQSEAHVAEARIRRWHGAVLAVAKNSLRRLIQPLRRHRSIAAKASAINEKWRQKKRVIICDMPRDELVQAFLNSDLFVFASNIEYSPLVLFEACAAGLAFLTVPVGNSAEICGWTGGGEICEASVDASGYTRVDPIELARRIQALVNDERLRRMLGAQGRAAWRERYNWESIADEYAALFFRLVESARTCPDGAAVSTGRAADFLTTGRGNTVV